MYVRVYNILVYLFVCTCKRGFTGMAEIPILTYSFETPAVLANQKLPEHVRVLVAKLRHRRPKYRFLPGCVGCALSDSASREVN